jgi:DNA-binding NarL/FixJ family response regulator
LQVICEVPDGLEAVQKANVLKPDLVLFDIGLPTLDGLEAARRIRKLSPESKILFVSQESSADVVKEAFRSGALGYVVKTHAGSESVAGRCAHAPRASKRKLRAIVTQENAACYQSFRPLVFPLSRRLFLLLRLA